jgi:O-antigen/teichoic acid export membrane protein
MATANLEDAPVTDLEDIPPEVDPARVERDLTGRDRLVSNVLFSWGGQLVFIIAGFVMPRMIDTKLGQDMLGVWDFAWSLVAYFQFIEAGITCSVNRYVGRYWATQDIPSINRVVSSATFVLTLAGLLVLVLTIGLTALLPHMFGAQLGKDAFGAQAAVFFLGAALCVQTALGAFNGVVTGCHRWELLNFNRSGWYLVTTVGMIAALKLGGGLLAMAVITFAGELLAQIGRVILAFRICHGLKLQKSLILRSTISELYMYGGKILIPSVSSMALNSTVSTLIVGYLGPAALALYMRPRSLTRQMDSLVRRMTMTLIPTTSSLEGAGDILAIRDLLVKSVRYTLYMVLPLILVLTIFGGPVMQLWMGPRYASDLIVAILAIGALGPLVQTPVLDILAGLNAHGRPGIAQFVASLLAIGLVYLALGPLHLGIIGVAIGISLPLSVVSTVYTSIVVCRKLALSVVDYVWSAWSRPCIRLLPFALILFAIRVAFRSAPLIGLAVGLALTMPILTIIYWRDVLPNRIKQWVRRSISTGLRFARRVQ